MGIQNYTDYTCDVCGNVAEKEPLSHDSLPRSWSRMLLKIWPAPGYATIRNIDKVLCQQCTIEVVSLITSKKEVGDGG